MLHRNQRGNTKLALWERELTFTESLSCARDSARSCAWPHLWLLWQLPPPILQMSNLFKVIVDKWPNQNSNRVFIHFFKISYWTPMKGQAWRVPSLLSMEVLICPKDSFLWITKNPHTNPDTQMILLSLYRLWTLKRKNNLSKVIWLVSDEAKFWI